MSLGPPSSADPIIKAGCPALDVLELAARSAVLDESLSDHMSGCPSCCALVSQLRSDNLLLAELAEASAGQDPSEESAYEVDGYEILAEIERGGQGIVYKGVHIATRRVVAVKMLLDGTFATTRQRRRFEREAEIAASLRHPNIVTVYDSGQTAKGHHFIAMEYVEGIPLGQFMWSRKVSSPAGVRGAVSLFASICEGVTAAHQRGIIHRDLKPANILVDGGGQPRILDFGLARQFPGAGLEATRTMEGEFRGTIAYAAPEQVAGKSDEVDVRTDVYALGIILYEMLTGIRAHAVADGSPGGVAQLIRGILEDSPADPRSVNRAIDDELGTIILKAMARDPARRYQSAGALLDDVRHYLAGEAINAKRDSRWYVFRKAMSRHRLAATGAAASLMLLVGFGAVMTVLYQRALAAEHAAQLRERELAQVVDFQAAQIGAIDLSQMALDLRAELLARSHESLGRRGIEAGSIDTELAELQERLAGVNFTDLARRLLDEHVFRISLQSIDEKFVDQPLVRARLLQTAATTAERLGLVQRAAAPQAEALAIRRRQLGDHHPETLDSIMAMGTLLVSSGRWAEAEPYYREAVDGRRLALGDGHGDTLNSLLRYGVLARLLGRPEVAEACFREAVASSRRAQGMNHPETLDAVSRLADVIRSQERNTEAEALYREVLAGYRAVLGDDHPRTLIAMRQIIATLKAQGRTDEAEEYTREALDLLRRVVQDGEWGTVAAINNMLGPLMEHGLLHEFEPYIVEYVDRLRSRLGDEHPGTLAWLGTVAQFAALHRRFDEAEQFIRFILDVRRRVLGDDHPHTLGSMKNMALFLAGRSRFDEAESCLQEAIEGSRRSNGSDHPRTLDLLSDLGLVLRKQRRLSEAEAHFAEALEGRRRSLGDGHTETQRTMIELARVLNDAGRQREAADLLEPAVRSARTGALHPGDLTLISLLLTYGAARAGLHEFSAAEAAFLEAYDRLVRRFDPPRRHMRLCMDLLIKNYESWHAAEPDVGHNASAAAWRPRLADLDRRQSAAAPADDAEP